MKYRIVKEYRPILGRIMYVVEKKTWFTWWWVDFKSTREGAEDLIKLLKSEGL